MFFQKHFSRQPDWLVAALITIAIIWLHFFFLFHAGGFWRDEVNSINLARKNFLERHGQRLVPGSDAYVGVRMVGRRSREK